MRDVTRRESWKKELWKEEIKGTDFRGIMTIKEKEKLIEAINRKIREENEYNFRSRNNYKFQRS